MPTYDHTGMKFHRLLAVERIATKGRATYRCVCDCGAQVSVKGTSLVTGNTKSCGCLQREAVPPPTTTHGHVGTPTYSSWASMNQRCRNEHTSGYEVYGGRGISICERWRSFENFLADMGERPAGTTLERINTDGNYEPGNCCWATNKEQQNNRRNNVLIEHQGRAQTVAQWAREVGVRPSLIYSRISRGWPAERALTTPNLGERSTALESHPS